jgi:hypothetical protein
MNTQTTETTNMNMASMATSYTATSYTATSYNGSTIEKLSVKFHDPTISLPEGLYDSAEGQFGTITLKLCNDIPIPAGTYLVNMEKDGSASMTESTNDGRSKDSHIRETICNTIEALGRIAEANPHAKIFIKLSEFDTRIFPVLALAQINAAVIDYMLTTVREKDLPNGSTNIEAALKNSNSSCDSFLATYPNAHVISVLTTDGDANEGNCNKYSLAALVKDKPYPTVCIGYGATHNSALMIAISSSYFYVSDLERAGEPIAEILHDFLHIAMEKVEMVVASGDILTEDQVWGAKRNIGNAIGGMTKTYNIRSNKPTDVQVLLYGKQIHNTAGINHVILADSAQYDGVTDLTRDIFRFKTVALLNEARKYLTRDFVAPAHPRYEASAEEYALAMEKYNADTIQYHANVESHKNDKKAIRDKLKDFFRLMKDYAKAKDMEQEPMMKQLLDDVYSIWVAFGRNFSVNEARAFTQAKYACNERQLSNNTSLRSASSGSARVRQNSHSPATPMRQNAQGHVFRGMGGGGVKFMDDDYDEESQLRTYSAIPCLARTPTCQAYPGMEEEFGGVGVALEDEDEDEDGLVHDLTDGVVSAYATQDTVTLMEQLSSHNI